MFLCLLFSKFSVLTAEVVTGVDEVVVDGGGVLIGEGHGPLAVFLLDAGLGVMVVAFP